MGITVARRIACLTGDVHHQSLGTREAPLIAPRSEIDLALEYARIAARHQLKVTLFVTGKALEEEWDGCRKLLAAANVELGAHTYSAFQTLWLHRASKALRGSYWLSRQQQRGDIARAVDIFGRRVGGVGSWRTHSYECNSDTPDLLVEHRIRVWSDAIDPSAHRPELIQGGALLSVPINVREDHSGFFHGFLTREFQDRQRHRLLARTLAALRGSGTSPLELTEGLAWEDGARRDIENAAAGGVATMNFHPVCMFLLDQFETFDRLCQYLRQYESLFMSELDARFFPERSMHGKRTRDAAWTAAER